MKLPITWILQHIKSNKSLKENEIIDSLIKLGYEVEAVEKYGEVKGPLVVGRVEKIEQLNEFKKPIRYCTVDVGSKKVGIVCGASNFVEKDLVVVALPGSELPGEFKIAERETYGRKSQGMICSAKELNISDDHSGIMVLNEPAKIGVDAKKLLGLNETVLDISVLPDRGYAMSVRGIARELATVLNSKFIDPIEEKMPKVSKSKKTKVKISTKNASKIALVRVENYNPESKTPLFIQNRLNQCGIRTISLPVDLTNYFMIEMGQPLHAFDADKVVGTIEIRESEKNEKLETLDHVIRNLDEKDLVIADSKKAISLAGVMGGLNSEVSAISKNLIIESAIFNQNSIGATSRKHKLPSEASKRFERGTDHEINELVAIKTAFYLQKFGNAKIEGIATATKSITQTKINFDLNEFLRLTGINISRVEILKILSNLNLVTSGKGSKLIVKIPSWRHDLVNNADLVEEILRVWGYHKIKGVLRTSNKKVSENQFFEYKHLISNKISSLGLNETLNYPFISSKDLDISNKYKNNAIKLYNPISETEPYLRTSLFPGLLKALERNLSRGQDNVQVYEAGHIFIKKSRKIIISKVPLLKKPEVKLINNLKDSLPLQPYIICGLINGSFRSLGSIKNNELIDWRYPISLVHDVLNEIGLRASLENADYQPFHPGRCGVFKIDQEVLGYAGEIHPKVNEIYGIKTKVFGFEIYPEFLMKFISVKQAPVFSTYPVVKEDLAFVFDKSVKARDVVVSIQKIQPDLIESVTLFDVYEGANLQKGRKSLAFNIRLRAQDKTLKTEEVSQLRSEIIAKIEKEFQAELR